MSDGTESTVTIPSCVKNYFLQDDAEFPAPQSAHAIKQDCIATLLDCNPRIDKENSNPALGYGTTYDVRKEQAARLLQEFWPRDIDTLAVLAHLALSEYDLSEDRVTGFTALARLDPDLGTIIAGIILQYSRRIANWWWSNGWSFGGDSRLAYKVLETLFLLKPEYAEVEAYKLGTHGCHLMRLTGLEILAHNNSPLARRAAWDLRNAPEVGCYVSALAQPDPQPIGMPENDGQTREFITMSLSILYPTPADDISGLLDRMNGHYPRLAQCLRFHRFCENNPRKTEKRFSLLESMSIGTPAANHPGEATMTLPMTDTHV